MIIPKINDFEQILIDLKENEGFESEAQKQLYNGYTNEEIEEMKDLIKNWDQGLDSSVEESVIKHANRHGEPDEDKQSLKYLRDSVNFNRGGKSVTVTDYRDDGTRTWYNEDTEEFLIENREGKILTYGKNNKKGHDIWGGYKR